MPEHRASRPARSRWRSRTRRGCCDTDAPAAARAGRGDPQGDSRPAECAGAARSRARAAWAGARRPSTRCGARCISMPAQPDAWRALGDHYTALEMREAADEAYAQSIRHSTRDPKLMGAALALVENRIPEAEARAARTPQAPSHRRRRHPHAGRSRGAHRPLSPMRRLCWRAAWNWRRVSRPRATTTRWCCTGRTSPRRRCAQVEMLLAEEPRNPGLSQSQGRDPRPHRRVREVHRAIPRRCSPSIRTRPRSG